MVATMRDRIIYTVGRTCAVVTRPLCLFVANNYFSRSVAEGLAIAFLSSALALIGTAADPHRRFYIQRFATDPDVNGLTFYIYAVSLVLLGVLGSIIVFAMGLHFTYSLALAAASVVYFLSEKLADELLRLRLFERDFGAWGRASIMRSALQFLGLAALLGVAVSAVPAWLLVLVLSIGNLAVFVPQLPLGFGRKLMARGYSTTTRLAYRAARSLLANRLLWVFTLITAGVGYLDRLVVLVLDKATLPLFMLVVMCFSVVQMAVDFYYVSQHRRDFLEQRISLGAAFTSREFLGSLVAGLTLAVIACIAVLRFSRNGPEFPFEYVLAISALQVLLAVVLVPQQILYWKQCIARMLRIEVTFWALFLGASLVCWWFRLPMVGVLALVVACAFTRFALYFAVALRAA